MIPRRCEPELMDLPDEVDAYARADFSEVNERFVQRALSMASAEDAVALLDAGCGPGDIPIEIARRRPKWSVLGVDASEPMLKVARTRAAGVANIHFALADGKALSAGLGQFDLVTSNSLLHHLPDPSGFWRSLKSIVKPGGSVFIRDLLRPVSESVARDLVKANAGNESALLQEEFYRSLLAAFTVAEVREQLDAAGLEGLCVAAVTDRHLDVWGELHG